MATAVVFCLFAAGVVFGYAALKPVLVSEGVYKDLCANNYQPAEMEKTCYDQEIRYGDQNGEGDYG